ncbi:MAG: hypothetical protein AAGI13_12780 [Pseudomonadota bacterium]
MFHPLRELAASVLLFALFAAPSAAAEDGPLADLPRFDGSAVLQGRALVSVTEPLVASERRVIRPEAAGLEVVLELFRAAPPDAADQALAELPEPSLTTAPDIEAALIDALIRSYGATGRPGAPLDDPDGLAVPSAEGARSLAARHPGQGIAVNIRIRHHGLELSGPDGQPLAKGAEAHLSYTISYTASLIDLQTGDLLAVAACSGTRALGRLREIAPTSAFDIAAIAIAEGCIETIIDQIQQSAGG